MLVTVSLALALLCVQTPGQATVCHNALIGPDTPKGEYRLIQRLTDDPWYGGDMLQFKENETHVFAIHRLWLGNPKEKRDQRILSTEAKDRRITKGCVNVSGETYKALIDCCLGAVLRIE